MLCLPPHTVCLNGGGTSRKCVVHSQNIHFVSFVKTEHFKDKLFVLLLLVEGLVVAVSVSIQQKLRYAMRTPVMLPYLQWIVLFYHINSVLKKKVLL